MMLAHNVHDVQVLQAPRPRQPAERHRQRVADAGAGQGILPAAQHRRRRPLSRPRRRAAAARRHARHDAVAWGYARGADALRRRHHPELRGHRRSAATPTARSRASRRRAASSRAKKVGVVAAGHTCVVMDMAGVRMPLESYPAAGAGLGAGQAGVPLRGDVEHGARLHQPVRQGRAGDRRRHRPVHLLQRSAAACTSSSTRSTRSASCSRSSAACACCATGAASST